MGNHGFFTIDEIDTAVAFSILCFFDQLQNRFVNPLSEFFIGNRIMVFKQAHINTSMV
jgi:hypothetical protein